MMSVLLRQKNGSCPHISRECATPYFMHIEFKLVSKTSPNDPLQFQRLLTFWEVFWTALKLEKD